MDVDKAVFETFAVSVAFLVIKVLAMGPLTARHRFKHKVENFRIEQKETSIIIRDKMIPDFHQPGGHRRDGRLQGRTSRGPP